MDDCDNLTPAKKLIHDIEQINKVADADIKQSFKSTLHHLSISKRLYIHPQTSGSWIKK